MRVQRDYYALLGVGRDATPAELRRAYERSLSRANRDGATRHMVDLVEAYDVLADPRRRAVYDQTGIGVVPERVPNTHGRAVPFRGGHAGLGARRAPQPDATVLPACAPPRRTRLVAVILAASVLSSLALSVALHWTR